MRLMLALAACLAAAGLVMPHRRWPIALIDTRVIAVVVGLGVLAALYGLHPLAASAPIPLAVVGPGLVGRFEARTRALRARKQWPDFLAIVRSRIGSGQPLPEAVRVAARALGGPFADLDEAWGGRFASRLEEVRRRWEDPVADRVLTTLRVAATTGSGHIDAVLSSLATSLSDELRMRAAHDAALTQQRLTAGVALVAPWTILLLSLATNPQAGAQFATSTGRTILVGGGIVTIGGFLLARRAGRLAQPPRIFE